MMAASAGTWRWVDDNDLAYCSFRYIHNRAHTFSCFECVTFIRAAPCENMFSGICGQRKPRSACASAQSDLDLHCPLTESLEFTGE